MQRSMQASFSNSMVAQRLPAPGQKMESREFVSMVGIEKALELLGLLHKANSPVASASGTTLPPQPCKHSRYVFDPRTPDDESSLVY